MNNSKMTATATTGNETTFDDVIDEILMTGETLTGAKLNEWISRFPQFEQGLTEFAINEAVSEVSGESEPMIPAESAARLARSQRIAFDAVKSKFEYTQADADKSELDAALRELAETLVKRYPNDAKRSKVWKKVLALAIETVTGADDEPAAMPAAANQDAGAMLDLKTIDTSKPKDGIETLEMPKFLTFYSDMVFTFAPKADDEQGTACFLFKNSKDKRGSKLVMMPREMMKSFVYRLHADFEREKAR